MRKRIVAEPVGFTVYAPYWYVDDLTESFIETKNHRGLEIVLAPVLTTTGGRTMRLPDLTLPPYSSNRLCINEHLEAQHADRAKRTDEGPVRWGDGSMANSLAGAAKLNVVSPTGADARAFSARIIIESSYRHLTFVASMFKSIGAVRATKLEGLWWFPHRDARVYFALQNPSLHPIKVCVDIFLGGHVVKTLRVPLLGSSIKLLDVGELLGGERSAESGGIRFALETKRKVARSMRLFARGIIVQEDAGFASPLTLSQSPGEIDSDAIQELHAPFAYFGRLGELAPELKGSARPYLFIRNATSRDLQVRVSLHGKDHDDRSAAIDLPPLAVSSQAVARIDLEEKRREAGFPLVDGIAGLRVQYNGLSTDLLAEVINVDDKGHTILYDSLKNPFFYRTALQLVISSVVDKNRRSFLVLKNVTNESQEARVLLHFENGTKRYDVKLTPIGPQELCVIDLQRLRDEEVGDANGLRLPKGAYFGGAAVFSRPGAFLISDPTFVVSVDGSRAVVDGFSCAAEPSGGGGGPPPPPPPPPICDAASQDLDLLKFWLEELEKELAKPSPSPSRIDTIKDGVRISVDDMIANLDAYITSGCCEPQLKHLEGQIKALPWSSETDIQTLRTKLLEAIHKAQEKARHDYVHC